jgi:anaerobic ribonucleoside-triphosphate reductase
MLFPATLNQVDRDGGYTGWNQAEFVRKLDYYRSKYYCQSPLYPCLDHGGPWLKDIHTRDRLSIDETMAEVKKIWSVQGDSVHENANIDASNPEGIHKHVADALSKEAALTLLPSHLSDLHNSGAFHIHDLEYFFTRQFCFDSDLRFIFRYGLLPDGTGANMPVAAPAKNAEVAVLHAAKALGCMQCMCAGGQGFQNFLTFLAPYFEGLEYGDQAAHADVHLRDEPDDGRSWRAGCLFLGS